MARGGFAEALLAGGGVFVRGGGGGGAELNHKEADGIGATTLVGAPPMPPTSAAEEASDLACTRPTGKGPFLLEDAMAAALAKHEQDRHEQRFGETPPRRAKTATTVFALNDASTSIWVHPSRLRVRIQVVSVCASDPVCCPQ